MTTNYACAYQSSVETETTEVQQRRSGWTATEKLAILAEYESYPHGDPRRGALLRRVGAYTSHISKWRYTLAPAVPWPTSHLSRLIANRSRVSHSRISWRNSGAS